MEEGRSPRVAAAVTEDGHRRCSPIAAAHLCGRAAEPTGGEVTHLRSRSPGPHCSSESNPSVEIRPTTPMHATERLTCERASTATCLTCRCVKGMKAWRLLRQRHSNRPDEPLFRLRGDGLQKDAYDFIDQLVSERRFGITVEVDAVAYGNVHTMRSARVVYVTFELRALRPHITLSHLNGRTSDPFALGDFQCRWNGLLLEARPVRHYRSARDAESDIRPFLDTWAAWVELTEQAPVEFKLRHWAVVDDDPPPGQSANAVATVSDAEGPRYKRPPLVFQRHPPMPPADFHTTPILEQLRKRWRLVMDRLALPTVEGYFVYTAILAIHGADTKNRRANAARALNVDEAVLRKVSELTSIAGNMAERRKLDSSTNLASLTLLAAADELWLVNAVTNLLIRMAQEDAHAHPYLTVEMLRVQPGEAAVDKKPS